MIWLLVGCFAVGVFGLTVFVLWLFLRKSSKTVVTNETGTFIWRDREPPA